MDEPHEVTEGLDASLASEVGDRVKKIVDDAEREAVATRFEADDEARAMLASARAEADRLRADALRQTQLAAAERVRQLRELQRQIEDHAEELAALDEDPQAVMARVDAFLEALEDRAVLVAMEAGGPPAEAETGAEADVAAEPQPEPEPVAASSSNGADGAAAVAPPPMPRPMLPGSDAELLEEARLGTLRMAVAGASRAELEPVLRQIFRPDDAVAVLDDVYGRPRSPFPKWASAAKRAG